MKRKIKDRSYRLLRDSAPLTFILPSKNSRRSPLLYFDESKNENRVLRYASNQRSPFEDEQDGNVLISPIIFEDGMLSVPKTNPVLQEFLHYHPLNGRKFEEVDLEKDAQEDLDYMIQEIDALSTAKELSIEQMETVGRVLLSRDVSTMTTSELRRDLLVYARRDSAAFMSAIENPELQLMGTINRFIDEKLLSIRNNGRDVYYNLKGNKKRLVAVPFGEDAVEFLSSYFKSDEGVEILEFLEKQLN
jgi:hypothetical protein